MPLIECTVSGLAAPVRLDKYAGSLDSIAVSRSRIKTGIQKATVNENPVKLSSKVKNGDRIRIEWTDPEELDILPEQIPLSILYEDENVTVLNKKQGMVCHPACGNWSGTLVNALLFHWGESVVRAHEGSAQFKINRPGIVHRLDKDTSGVIITAKNREAETWLQNRFRARKVKKQYIAIVKGHPPAQTGQIKTYLTRDPGNRKRFIVSDNPDCGKFAHTDYICIAVYGPYSLMRLTLKTGRTHQIRVHLKHIGCPILGDPIYSRSEKQFPGATLMLHSRTLGIKLPVTNEKKEFKAPVPLRFKKVLQTLHKMYQRTNIPLPYQR